MRVLVTRPEEDARPLVAALEARGHEVVVEPMLRVTPAAGVTPPLDLAGVQALLFTSANGARVFARLSEVRDLPVFTVGDASAAAARDAGFRTVESAGGDVEDLARLVAERLDPAAGSLYQAAASRLAGDLKGALEAAGFTLRREVLYEATPVTDLSGTLRLELATGRIEVATFFSPRTAETFVGLVEKLGLAGGCAEATALCLSEAVAETLRRLDWRAVAVAERPNQDALLARLDELAPGATKPAPAKPAAPAAEAAGGAQRVITSFGGIRPMAGKLGVAVSTVQGWRERGVIPARHHARVLEAARAEGLDIAAADLRAVARPSPSKTAAPETTAPKAATSKPAPKPATSAATRAAAKPRPEATAEPEAETAPEPQPTSEPEGAPKPEARPRAETPAAGPAAAPPRASWLPGALLGAALVVLGAGGAMLARDLWMPLVVPEAGLGDGGELMSLERRIAALESAESARPAALAPGALAPLAESLDALQDRVAALAEAQATLGPVDESGLAARLEQLSERLDGLGARLDEIAAAAPDSGALAELSARVDELAETVAALGSLDARVEELAARPDVAPEIAALRERVEALAAARVEAEVTATGDAALALAVLQLRAAVQGSGPFAVELGLLQDLAASGALAEGPELAELIAPLATHAASGIPSLAGLKAEFPAVARRAVIASRGGAGEGWWAGVVRRLSDLASLRPVGPVEGESAGAVVARAEARVRADDLAAALDELAALEGPAAEAVRPWREAAAARLAARRALTGLGRLLLARLQAGGG